MAQVKNRSVAHSYAVRLMEHLVVPTFVIDPKRRVVIWNRACERLTGVAASEVLGTTGHWRAFYRQRRYCLADLVALDRPDKLAALYAEGGSERRRRGPERRELVRDAKTRQSALSRHRRRLHP
jgi:PAS domain S-box-containing protein